MSRIQTNIPALTAHRFLSDTTKLLNRTSERLSSGYRINRAADDAAGLAIANKFRSDIRGMQVAQRNASEATSLVQIAEGAVNNIESILTRMKDLAIQAASANSEQQASTLNTEYQALKSEIDRIVSGTKYQGNGLIDGTFTAKNFQVGTTSATYDRITISLGNLGSAAIGKDGTDAGTAVGPTDRSTGEIALADTYLIATDLSLPADGDTLDAGESQQEMAREAMDVVDAALVMLREELGSLGAYQNRLDYASSSLASAILNYSASESVIRDADMAYEMVNFTKQQILQQSATAMLAQANAAPQSVLSLLR